MFFPSPGKWAGLGPRTPDISRYLQERSPHSLETSHLTHCQLGCHGTWVKTKQKALKLLMRQKSCPGCVSTLRLSFLSCKAGLIATFSTQVWDEASWDVAYEILGELCGSLGVLKGGHDCCWAWSRGRSSRGQERENRGKPQFPPTIL